MGKEPVDPIYTKDDAMDCMKLFIGVAYDRKFKIDENVSVKFINTGHMLGSGVAFIEIREDNETHKIAYTGDIGRPHNRILKPPQPFPQADILITEATYGNRLHDDIQKTEEILLDIIDNTCVKKGGKLIIPSFSVGRTQEIVYTLNNFYNDRKLPKIDIYVDSPLAINATEVFRMHPECFNKDVLHVMETDDDPFGFNSLHYIRSHQNSKKLNYLTKPAVIISASGMMEAGRVKHHLANNISNERNTILAVGYCAPNTLGARILSGDKQVSIHGQKHIVRADIQRIDSYSGHGDYTELMDYLGCQDNNKIKNIFIVHGDLEPQKFYKGKLEEKGYKNINIPDKGDEFYF